MKCPNGCVNGKILLLDTLADDPYKTCPVCHGTGQVADKPVPTPTPDLLLTDEEIRKLPHIKMLLNREDEAKRKYATDILYENESKESGLLVSTALVVAKQMNEVLSKLQQARPTTEQAREKIARIIFLPMFDFEFDDGTEVEQKDAFEVADQILRLIPFPDEQGIRESERKATSEKIFQFFSSHASSVLFDGENYNEQSTIETISVFGGKDRKVPCYRYRIEASVLDKFKASLKAGEPPQEGVQ